MSFIKLKKLCLIASFMGATAAANAEIWECRVNGYGALRGYESAEAAKSWLPQVIPVDVSQNQIRYFYYDEQHSIDNPKPDGEWFGGRTEQSTRSNGQSFILKLKFLTKPSTHEAKLSFTINAPGYVPAGATGYYGCYVKQ